jgi:hypothetical protein
MSEIIENLLTDLQKYFINCAISNTGIFVDLSQMKPDDSVNRIDVEVANVLGLN